MIPRNVALAVLLMTPLVGWSQDALAPVASIPTAPASAGARLMRAVYPVADLVVPVRGLDFPQTARREEDNNTKEQWLIDKITTTVTPRAWKCAGGLGEIEYRPGDMSLVVRQTPEVQAQVADLLTTMQRVQNVEVAVEARIMTMSVDSLPRLRALFPKLKVGGQAVLSAADTAALLTKLQQDSGVQALQAPKITAFSGQQCRLSIADVLDTRLRAVVAANLRHVDLYVKGGPAGVKFNKTAHMVDGSTLVLAARADQETCILFLLTPRVLINVDNAVPTPKVMPAAHASERPIDGNVIHVSGTEARPIAGEPDFQPPARAPVPGVAVVRDREVLDGQPARQLRIKVAVCEGDPLGSREGNTQRVLAEPTVTVTANQSFFVQAGGQFPVPIVTDARLAGLAAATHPYGITIEGKPGAVKDGKVRIDLTVSKATLGDGAKDRVQLHTESTHTIATVKLREMARFRLARGTADNQSWVEMTVEEVPANVQPAASGLVPAGTLTPDLGVPVRASRFDFTAPPFGGYPDAVGR